MKIVASIALLFLCVVASSGQTQKSDCKIYPVDETGKDASLVAFVAELNTILIEKDTARLFAIMHPKIVTSFGGVMFGKQDFISQWHLEKAEESEVWALMLRVIDLGGLFCDGIFDEDSTDTAFCYPYATADQLYKPCLGKTSELFFDPYVTCVCINDNVPVYENCDVSSKQIASFSFDILQIDYDMTIKEQPDEYMNFPLYFVSSIDGLIKGWINSSDIYALGGRQLILEKSDGKWIITGFVAFD